MILYFKRLIDRYTEEGTRSAFEKNCSEVLGEEFPGTIPIRANLGDKGIDCLYRMENSKCIVYQSKYFTEEIEESQKEQIRKSFKQSRDHLKELRKHKNRL